MWLLGYTIVGLSQMPIKLTTYNFQYKIYLIIKTFKLLLFSNIAFNIGRRVHQEQSLRSSWQGALLSQWDDNQTVKMALPDWSVNMTSHEYRLTINFDEIRATWDILSSDSAQYQINRSLTSSTQIEPSRQSYSSTTNINVAPQSNIELFTTHSYFHNKVEANNEQALIADALSKPDKYLLASKKR